MRCILTLFRTKCHIISIQNNVEVIPTPWERNRLNLGSDFMCWTSTYLRKFQECLFAEWAFIHNLVKFHTERMR